MLFQSFVLGEVGHWGQFQGDYHLDVFGCHIDWLKVLKRCSSLILGSEASSTYFYPLGHAVYVNSCFLNVCGPSGLGPSL